MDGVQLTEKNQEQAYNVYKGSSSQNRADRVVTNMGDLFKTLFEDLPEPDDDLMRLLEAAERVEKMEINKKPLEDALKDLHIEGELVATPDGIKVVFPDDASFHAATKVLGQLSAITQLAGHGWVPVCGGDVRPGDESPEYTWKFLEVDDVPLDSNNDAPSSEEIASAAMKFNGFTDQAHKATEPPMQGNSRGVVKKARQNNPLGVKEGIEDLSEGALDFIMKWEDGQCSPEEEIAGFQNLLDTGTIYSLQGMYGRRAQELIDAGELHRPGSKPSSYHRTTKGPLGGD